MFQIQMRPMISKLTVKCTPNKTILFIVKPMTAKGINLVAPLNKTGPVLSTSSCICKSFLRRGLSAPRKLNTESVFLVLFLCEQSTP